jgi:hypothetical protein
MTILEYIQSQISMTHWGGAAAFADLTDAQFNWAPPGRANSIAVTLLHAYGIEDAFIQGKLLNQPQLWDSEGWAAKVGVAEIPDLGNRWAGMREVALAKAPVLAYGQAVQDATDRYLATLTVEELDKPMQLGPRTGTVAELLSILVVHNLSHGGEIAALKGFQGLQGQPV